MACGTRLVDSSRSANLGCAIQAGHGCHGEPQLTSIVLQVRDGLAAAAQACGVDIRTNTEVRSIDCKGDHVTGVTLASGEHLAAEVVIANRDVPGAYNLLHSDGRQTSYGQRRRTSLAAKRFSAGVIAYNWVVKDAGFPALLHHNVFLSGAAAHPRKMLSHSA